MVQSNVNRGDGPMKCNPPALRPHQIAVYSGMCLVLSPGCVRVKLNDIISLMGPEWSDVATI